MKYQQFYSEVGKLLYAIAKADGRVGDREFASMKEIVVGQLAPLEASRDQFGTDNAYYAEMEFEYLQEHFAEPQVAFDSFLGFLDEHHSALSADVKQLIVRVSETIAASEFGVNKKEKAYLELLNRKLAELQ